MDMSDPIAQNIARARILLLLQNPFFGNMALHLKPILTDGDKDSWCHTAATDGRRLYMSRTFCANLSPAELLFVVAHEVLHVVYSTIGRRGGRDPKIYNMASDYVINYTLVKNRIGEMPPIGLYDEKYNDTMTSEEIYDLLIKNNVTVKAPLDQHIDGDGGADGNTSGTGKEGGKMMTVTVGGANGPPKLSREELDDIEIEVRGNVIQAAMAAMASDNPGCIPAGVRRMISELNDPKMDWRAMLDCHLRSAQKDNFTFMKLSRRQVSGGFMFPAQDDMDIVEVDVCADTSGSMTADMLRDILSEVRGIMVTFGDFKLRVWTFDTKVYNVKEFTPQNIDEIHEYEMVGGGGTSFECNWEFMKENGIEPHRLLCFTDGFPNNTWGDPDYCETIFIIHGNDTIVAPFGVTAYYSE